LSCARHSEGGECLTGASPALACFLPTALQGSAERSTLAFVAKAFGLLYSSIGICSSKLSSPSLRTSHHATADAKVRVASPIHARCHSAQEAPPHRARNGRNRPWCRRRRSFAT